MKKINNNNSKIDVLFFFMIVFFISTVILYLFKVDRSFGQTQSAKTSEGGPVYNFQFFNSPTPTAVIPTTATTATTNPTPQAQTQPQQQVQQPQPVVDDKRQNKWVPSFGYFTLGSTSHSNSITFKGITGNFVALKIPVGTKTSLVPKYLFGSKEIEGKPNRNIGSTGYTALGLDYRADFYSGENLATAFGVSALGATSNQEDFRSLGAGLFVAPNYTYKMLNVEVSGHLGYQFKQKLYSGYSFSDHGSSEYGPISGEFYSAIMLNAGVAI
ncbi:MAG: hypothetical protein HQK49_14460 [Oligoflexia bacterium]|nr:hypothetical protein [Oligoflexia bacterium]